MITYTYWPLEGIPPFRTPVSTSLGGYLLSSQLYSLACPTSPLGLIARHGGCLKE